jgi:uncharacterized membrane protein
LGFTLVGWVIALVWSLSATKVTSTQGTFKQLNALEIAKERFARGEITNEEFDNIKRRLS